MVNSDCLFEPRSCSSCLVLSLTSCQIYQVDHWNSLWFRCSCFSNFFELYCENSMRTRTCCIHLSCSNCSVFGSFFHYSLDISKVINKVLFGALNVNTKELVLPNFETTSWSFWSINCQILDCFVIYFKHRNMHLELFFWLFLFDSLKNLVASNWNYPFIRAIANHAVWFTRASLPISEQTAMIALPCVVQYFSSDLVVDIVLIRIPAWSIVFKKATVILILYELVEWPERIVKCKLPFRLSIERLEDSWLVLHVDT